MFDYQGFKDDENVKSTINSPKLIRSHNPFELWSGLSTKYCTHTEFEINGIIRRVIINYLVLIESMAYLVELHYGLKADDCPDFPYRIISKVIEQTQLKGMHDKLILMIYLSLQNPFPDRVFKSAL